MLDNRHLTVLEALVQEYVRSAEPVGSAALVRALQLGVSSATMRTILRDLAEAGFLEQPHTSAGRVPTDQGYRYVVDHEPSKEITPRERAQIVEELRELSEQYQQLARATSKLLARMAQTVAVSSSMPRHEVADAGLPEMLQQPEAKDIDTVREITTVAEEIDRYMDRLGTADDQTRVYIGHENPYFPLEHSSVVVRAVTTPSQEKMVLLLVGPKRMRYGRNVALINTLASIVQQYDL